MSSFDLERCNLAALNTLTKYPSIETYHVLGDKGRLKEECRTPPAHQILHGVEKIDGTNVRMLFLPDGRVVLGSRENLLWADGDLFGDPAQGIVDGLRATAVRLNGIRTHHSFVLYGEFYGGKVTAASKQYTSDPTKTAFRVFDLQFLSREQLGWLGVRDLSQLAVWREGNQ